MASNSRVLFLIKFLCVLVTLFPVVNGQSLPAQDTASPSDRVPTERVLSNAENTAISSSVQPTSLTLSSSNTPEQPLLLASASDPQSRELQSLIIQAVGELDATKIPKIEQAKSRVVNAILRLENYVGLSTQRGQAWASFLKLEEIKQELQEERLNSAKFQAFEMNMCQNYVGLEYAAFLELRESLNELVRAIKYGSDTDRTLKLFETRMSELVESLSEPIEGAAAKRASDVGLITSYLGESGQAPATVAKIREKFLFSNVTFSARESLLNRLLGRGVDQPSPVNECLLGTRIMGRACLSGFVSADLLPMSGGVSLSLNLSANLSTNNTGYNRGVVLRTTGSSPVFATKQLFVTPNGVSSSPTQVATDLKTQINAIEHKLRIVRRIATKKAAEQKPLADSIAQGRLQKRVASQYDQQVDEQLVEANSRLATLQQPRAELKRFAIPQPSFAIFSSDSAIYGDVVQAASYQLAAGQPCKIPQPSSAEIVVRAHQSLAINLLESLLSGRTIHNHDLDDLAKQLLGEVPPEIMTEVNGKSWHITMATFNPVQLEFDDNRVKLTLRITHMQGEDRTLPSGAIIAATYEPSFSGGVLALRRLGDLEIEVPGVRSNLQATSLRSVVKTKFDPIFKEEIVTEKLDLAQLFPKARDFVVDSFKIDDGWLQVGVR